MAIPRFSVSGSAVLVVDVQEKLLPAMHNSQQVLEQVCRLLDIAGVLEVPILATEQYRKGLGPTVPEVEKRLAKAVWRSEKMQFSACVPELRMELARRGISHVAVCGIEAHVCVLQTCLDLLEAGYTTAVVTDAVGSRRAMDHQMAIERLIQAGVIPTTVESLALELVRQAGTGQFKCVLPLIK